MSQFTTTQTRQAKASRIAEVAAIGSRTRTRRYQNRSSQPRQVTPRGAGVLATVSNGLFGGRARPDSAVVERFSNPVRNTKTIPAAA